jgi:hypothetical protein
MLASQGTWASKMLASPGTWAALALSWMETVYMTPVRHSKRFKDQWAILAMWIPVGGQSRKLLTSPAWQMSILLTLLIRAKIIFVLVSIML